MRFNRVFAWVGIERLANIYPELYEAFFSGLIPAREILFQLKTVKRIKTTGTRLSNGTLVNGESSDLRIWLCASKALPKL